MSWKFSKYIENEFEMSFIGELNLFLGLRIYQCDTCIFISHTKYIKEMLKRFGMEEIQGYRSMIGILLYVMSSRSYVMQAIGHVSIFQESPKETHVVAVKIIFEYLKAT
jgi:hypothetical protein